VRAVEAAVAEAENQGSAEHVNSRLGLGQQRVPVIYAAFEGERKERRCKSRWATFATNAWDADTWDQNRGP
jgi:hypothetical protein